MTASPAGAPLAGPAFSTLPLAVHVLANLQRLGYEHMTPIQAASLPRLKPVSVSVTLGARPSKDRWQQVEEWVRTSYTLVAPKKLAKVVLEEDGLL